MKGMTGIRSGSTLSEASEASPRASPPSAAAAMLGDSQSGHRSRPGVPGLPARSGAHPQRVSHQAQAPEQQQLGQRLGERRPAHVLLREGDREDQGRRGRPLGAREPPGQAAEGEHGQGAEHRADQFGGGHAVNPPAAGHHHGQPGRELRGQAAMRGGQPGAGEPEPGVRAAEVVQRRRDGQRPVARDPVAELEHRARLAQHDDLRRIQPELPRPEPGRDDYRARQAPPAGPRGGGPARLARGGLTRGGWPVVD